MQPARQPHAAARMITGVRRYQHITAALRDTLHWLPVPQRILFKVALMALDCVRGQGPGYFDDVLVPVHTVGARARLRYAGDGDIWSSRVPVLCVSVSAASAHPHHNVWNKLNNLQSELKNSDITHSLVQTEF